MNDLLPFVIGNRDHVRAVRKSGRAIEALTHGERAILFGTGFGWHQEPNYSVIIGPYNTNLRESLRVAMHIIEGNVSSGVIPAERTPLFMTSAPYFIGRDRQRATLKSQFLMSVMLDVRGEFYKDLRVEPVVCVTDMSTRRLEVVAQY